MCASGWDTHTLAGETVDVGLSLFIRFLDNKKIWNITRRQHFNSYLSSDFPESREPLVNGFHFGLTSYIILSWSSSALRFHYVESTCSNVTDRPSGNNTEREADGVMQRERERDDTDRRVDEASDPAEIWLHPLDTNNRKCESGAASDWAENKACIITTTAAFTVESLKKLSEQAEKVKRALFHHKESLVCLMTADTNKHREEEEVCFKTNTHTISRSEIKVLYNVKLLTMKNTQRIWQLYVFFSLFLLLVLVLGHRYLWRPNLR